MYRISIFAQFIRRLSSSSRRVAMDERQDLYHDGSSVSFNLKSSRLRTCLKISQRFGESDATTARCA